MVKEITVEQIKNTMRDRIAEYQYYTYIDKDWETIREKLIDEIKLIGELIEVEAFNPKANDDADWKEMWQYGLEKNNLIKVDGKLVQKNH